LQWKEEDLGRVGGEKERGVRYIEKGEQFIFFQPRERKSMPK